MWPFSSSKFAEKEEYERKLKQANAKAEALIEFAEFEEADQVVLSEIKEFVPKIKIKRFKAGEFLLYDDHHIFMDGIKEITVYDTGTLSHIGKETFEIEDFYGVEFRKHCIDKAKETTDAAIWVVLKSERYYIILCHPLEVDILFHHLTKAFEDWKKQKGKSSHE